MKRKRSFSLVNMLFLLALIVGFSACKNKKKVTEVSDPNAVKVQIEEELEDDPEEDTRVASKEPTRTEKLETYFSAIASAQSVSSANGTISEALTLFSSPDAPVLVVIYNTGGMADYDEPTTIKKYLEYLKDTKNNNAGVDEMVLDDYGKIQELVLRKK